MNRYLTLIFLFLIITVKGQQVTYSDNWGKHGLTVISQDNQGLVLNYSIQSFSFRDVDIKGEMMKAVNLPGVFLPNDAGSPDLPGFGRYIAIPEGASAEIIVEACRVETIADVDIAPAFEIPLDTYKGPLVYEKNQAVYSADKYYPAEPVKFSEQTEIRGIDARILGITPYQYNPVTRELLVYRDIKIRVHFNGGKGTFGEDRLRSRWWDPIISDVFMNSGSIQKADYSWMYKQQKTAGCEYLIISPDGPEFLAWADSIKLFRNKQGILTKVASLSEIGGNNTNTIENYINNAYNTWDIPPSAILFLGDYGTNAANSVISPVWGGYCISDNLYADVNNDDMPDISTARITAQDESQLQTIIQKFLNYETNPPASPDFYDHPITAMGWQTERWFQICSEVINGFFEYNLGKNPVRENNIYEGVTTGPWSSAPNTYMVTNYFGPNGLGYIPATPNHLTDWDADAESINEDIENGAFMMVHRDHGFEQGWGEPNYNSSHVQTLDNDELIYVFSVNCLTGKFNWGNNCFSEVFHRHPKGALGLIAATEVSYSFVNDVYVWGSFDNMWPDFMPDYGTMPPSRGILPAFGNSAGKFFLQQSVWPYNTANKEVTYYLFHHHGDAFSTVYSEVPQPITITYDNAILAGSEVFPFMADAGTLVCLSVNGEIIGVAESSGGQDTVFITGQAANTQITITATKQNYYRYEATVNTIPATIPYVIKESFIISDNNGNNNGLLDYGENVSLSLTMKNIGMVQANNVTVELSSANPDITITDNSESYGNIPALTSVTKNNAFAFGASVSIPDGTNCIFTVTATDGTNTWYSDFFIPAHAPLLEMVSFTINDPSGNNNGRLDPGETADMEITLINNGSSGATAISGELVSENPLITISNPVQTYGNLNPGNESAQTFTVNVSPAIPEGEIAQFSITFDAAGGLQVEEEFQAVIGKYSALILDLDPNHYSGPAIQEAFQNMDVSAEYMNQFPEDIGLYKNVFVCLGIRFQNYVLSDAEGQILKDFLEAGGNLYMEGRVTWFEDPPTPVHPLFNIQAQSGSYYVMSPIAGIEGTFASGMNFVFEGVQAVNNHNLVPSGTAFEVMEVTSGNHAVAIANDAITYKTVGTNFEFGKLTDGVAPSTKAELLVKILGFFDIFITGNKPVELSNTAGIYPNPFSDRLELRINIENEAYVSATILDMQGRETCHLINGQVMETGHHEFILDVRDNSGNKLKKGIYICRVKVGDNCQYIKLIKSE